MHLLPPQLQHAKRSYLLKHLSSSYNFLAILDYELINFWNVSSVVLEIMLITSDNNCPSPIKVEKMVDGKQWIYFTWPNTAESVYNGHRQAKCIKFSRNFKVVFVEKQPCIQVTLRQVHYIFFVTARHVNPYPKLL